MVVLMLTPLACRVISRIRRLNRSKAFGATFNLWTGGKAESEKLSLLWSCHCALRLIYLELEFVRDESRNALHHSLTGLLAAHVDVAVIGVAGVAVSAAL